MLLAKKIFFSSRWITHGKSDFHDDYVSSCFKCKFFCFSQNSIMDITGFFNGGKKKKAKTLVLKRNDPLKKVQVQDLYHQSGNFYTRLVSCLTGLNAANQNHLNELRRFQFKYFVQWPRVFLTSNLSGQHITKKNPVIFPYYEIFRTLFFFETSLKKKKRNTEMSL